jgi:MEMO1 family protein
VLPPNTKLRAIIGPHAGFRYSGPNAAWAYKHVQTQSNQFDRVVLMGPSHKVGFDFVAQTTCAEWETPLGNLSIDKQRVAELEKSEHAKFQ